MKSLRTKFLESRQRLGLPWEIIERDYILSWILAGISRVSILHDNLIFKGGTALKKCYFGDYRFSEDLDFSVSESAPKGNALEAAMKEDAKKQLNFLTLMLPLKLYANVIKSVLRISKPRSI